MVLKNDESRALWHALFTGRFRRVSHSLRFFGPCDFLIIQAEGLVRYFFTRVYCKNRAYVLGRFLSLSRCGSHHGFPQLQVFLSPQLVCCLHLSSRIRHDFFFHSLLRDELSLLSHSSSSLSCVLGQRVVYLVV